MTNNKTDAQMFLEEQLRDPEVAVAFSMKALMNCELLFKLYNCENVVD